MRKTDGFFQAILIKIIRIGPGAKLSACHIDSVGTAFYGGNQGLTAASRG